MYVTENSSIKDSIF